MPTGGMCQVVKRIRVRITHVIVAVSGLRTVEAVSPRFPQDVDRADGGLLLRFGGDGFMDQHMANQQQESYATRTRAYTYI